jgi:hypothetical protein
MSKLLKLEVSRVSRRFDPCAPILILYEFVEQVAWPIADAEFTRGAVHSFHRGEKANYIRIISATHVGGGCV